jgi:hypothetical protein
MRIVIRKEVGLKEKRTNEEKSKLLSVFSDKVCVLYLFIYIQSAARITPTARPSILNS